MGSIPKYPAVHVTRDLILPLGVYRTLPDAMLAASRFLTENTRNEGAGWILATPWMELEADAGIGMSYFHADENGPIPGVEKQYMYILFDQEEMPEDSDTPGGKETAHGQDA